MTVVSAFKDGTIALRRNPTLLIAGLLVGAGSQLQSVGDLVESPIVESVLMFAWILVFPFVLGGFIGMARSAIQDSDASLWQFINAGRTYYVRLLLATILFALCIIGVMFALLPLGFVTGFGFIALGSISEMAGFGVAIGIMLVWLLVLLIVIMFIQFYDTAIVIENEGIADSFRRSVSLVRSNLKSVVGFSLVWLLLLNAFLIPEYLLQLTLTDTGVADVLPFNFEIPIEILLPIGIVLSAVGFAYFYTVYTAYYLRLIAESPIDSQTAEARSQSHETG